jgi:molybdenum cofactor cytidylyltransferase
MGSSIACGIRASQDESGWLIMLADMPYVKTQTIQLLADKLASDIKIVAPTLAHQRRHPVGLNQCYKNELLALIQDVGAREIIKARQNQLELVPVSDTGIITDVDQHGDLLSTQ